ncbi:hypothetical protein TNCT6_68040 [Streptomyces sp. 6-11-2]|nr:hypothetical protein TNCT6_68040 [Streptomyces sp. 6-11-2]
MVSMSDTLVDALVTATQNDLVRFAELWSMTDELRQMGISVEVTASLLENLAELAQRAQSNGLSLYCWWTL